MNDYPKLISGLKQDHARFGQLIRVLEHELQQIRRGESEDWKLLADSFEYIEAYPDLVHHPKENAVYRYSAEAYPETAESLAGLEEEHHKICVATTQLAQELNGILSDNFLDREALIEDLEAYLKMQSAHMVREEEYVFPLLLEHLSKADWEGVLEELESPADPLFEDESRLAYDALYQRIMTMKAD